MYWLIILGVIGLIWVYSAYLDEKNRTKQRTYTDTQLINKPIINKPRLNVKQADLSNVSLSDEQRNLFERFENSAKNMFITGKAGTGKSILLQYCKQKSSKRIVVAAPTGVAALNVGGQTIHSLFKIPPSFIATNSLRVSSKTALLLRNIDAVVIDEISMVRADLMDAIDHLLRQARDNNNPFGGVQMVMFGDLYQLPPVVSDPELHKYFTHNHGGYYFFNAHAWKNTPIEIFELSKIFRQKDSKFKDILNAIRVGKVTTTQLEALNNRVNIPIPDDGVITLATTNNRVNEINSRRLALLDGETLEYRACIIGDLKQSAYPTEETLQLKKGAQVMLLKNDKEKRWVNGSLGFIKALSNNQIKVDIDGITYSVPQETWSKIRYYYDQETRKVAEEIVSSFTQFPLRLAWAITVHKSQGQTYGSIAVDMGDGAFANGQTYVALSRCKSLEGLYLKREILRQDILVDQDVIKFMSKAKIYKSTKTPVKIQL